jgi:methylphosphotriester-DNA--protein-cysteine methyltransferase
MPTRSRRWTLSSVIAFIGGWLLLAILTAVVLCRAICKAKQREGKR